MPVNQLLDLEQRHAHLDAQIFHFLTAGDNTAVIVTEHSHRLADQVGPEHTLTRNVKIVAIDQGDQRRRHSGWITLVTTPQITSSRSS
jgi:UPF0288 family protein (methanogenesis marker protein 3)